MEFSTLPHHQLRFFKISSGAIAFSIKGERQSVHRMSSQRRAAVGLAVRPGKTCDYWIVIAPNKCWLEKDAARVGNIRQVPDMVTGREYNKFWISWHKARLQFGRTSDGIPLISKRMLVQDIQYVTFTIFGDRGHLQWKIYLPPKLEKPILKNVTGGELKWVEAEQNGKLPHGALIGGYENEILYIIRAKHERSLVPGKYVPSHGLGYISWINMPEKKKFEVLCGYNCIWVPTCNKGIPLGAVEGGYDGYNRETLYVGRALIEDNLIPGKVQTSQVACVVPYKMADVPKYEYEILVDPMVYSNSCLLPLTPQMLKNCSMFEPMEIDSEEHSSDSEV
ncbi:uncharacterized protein LOC123878130 isoform X1 [Maniola jurtina]|uniref:uncharacterized protein LOC123878130 isoform X1 n=1 Tax=Maniola jurtina TaxID=191418 RepID=UPI001E68BBFF|nr:uncharacterized protein LOC123878130 isoform X1 [Maniola jurtina]